MDTSQIDYLMRADVRTAVHYVGTFAANRLPSHLNAGKFVICNEDSDHYQGTHWLCFGKNKKSLVFFDSFGRPPYTPYFVQFVDRNSGPGKLKYCSKQLQSQISNLCGLYCCIFALYHMSYRYSVNKILKIFGQVPELNDCLIQKLFQSQFGQYMTLSPTSETRLFCQRSKALYTYRPILRRGNSTSRRTAVMSGRGWRYAL